MKEPYIEDYSEQYDLTEGNHCKVKHVYQLMMAFMPCPFLLPLLVASLASKRLRGEVSYFEMAHYRYVRKVACRSVLYALFALFVLCAGLILAEGHIVFGILIVVGGYAVFVFYLWYGLRVLRGYRLYLRGREMYY
ncbi:hypothetical protein AB4254_13580 [Vibrio breoganii]